MATEGLPKPLAYSLRERLLALLSPPRDAEDPLHARKKPANLLYDVDETPPFLMRLGVSIQHVFLMSVGWLYIVVIVNSIGGTEAQTEDHPHVHDRRWPKHHFARYQGEVWRRRFLLSSL